MNELIDTTSDFRRSSQLAPIHSAASADSARGERGTPVTEDTARQDFVGAMRQAATGVSLVTTDGPAGRFGLTVSAMCSVSADPPTVLACIHRKSPIRSAMLRNQRFCVNVLSTRQHRLANLFAGIADTGPAYDFAAARWQHGSAGAPRLVGAVANFDCLLDKAHEAGSHTIFIGHVTAAVRQAGKPLLYTDRHYGIPLTWD
jgi:flavin reductase (DIM6/NTAB) family NADH-FMN oxidoreductase RutF